MPQSPAALLARMRSSSPASPRLIWHGNEGRIELSGRVFDNWVAKSSNLLVEELDAVEGTEVAFDLPVHWKTLALAFACWRIGAVVVLADGHDPDAREELSPDAVPEGELVLSATALEGIEPPRVLVCVALGSLAPAWEGSLPTGAVDFAAEVRSQDDVFPDPVGGGVAGSAPLVRVGRRTLDARDLVRELTSPSPVTGSAGSAPGRTPTLLLEPGSTVLRALAAAYTLWEGNQDGALVLVEEGVAVSEGMVLGERITDRL
ncbi:hypothetical protein E8P82_03345 [Arthrobacter echini]|uniref:TIGR03089 family protein n=1 Tax=Arthrobacter echini TaxID=1529066 RepID=A0A4S5E892_9MICC|nr:TIGR03089 family protein [Arthrobacter echini]THJ67881.1 hypothetical protein E8P82_03345 [Arthrobacter echini]